MSYNASRWVFEQTLTPTEKLILLKLAHHAEPDGTDAYPSVDNIARDTGVGKRQVQRYLKTFVERGFLAIDDHAKGGRGLTRTYRFTFVKGDTQTTPFSEENSDIQESPIIPERVTFETERVTSDDVKGDIHACAEVNTQEHPIEHPTPQPPTGAGGDGFDEFWTAFPRKVGKRDARKWWDKHKPDDDLQTAILTAIAWQRNTPGWRKNNGEYIPHPTTWLNRGSWEDERPNNMVTLAAPKVVTNPDYEGTYDPLRKFTPEAEAEYHEQLIEAIARTDGISREEARVRVKGQAA